MAGWTYGGRGIESGNEAPLHLMWGWERRREDRFAWFLLVSLLLHALALYELVPKLGPLAFDDEGDRGTPLVARMESPKIGLPPELPAAAAPPPTAPPTPAPAPRPSPPPMARATPPAAPRVLDAPASPLTLPAEPLARIPETAVAPLPSAPTMTPPPTPESVTQAYPDLASYVAARRRARGESPEGSEDDNARRDRLVAQNLASVNSPTFGSTRHTGGLFQITRLGYDDAEFTFFGWHSEIKRRAQQRIEVRRGDERDIRIAVVRRMIAIIRQYEQEDFTWRSSRLGRDITLSARLSDSAGLEEFLMREFFF